MKKILFIFLILMIKKESIVQISITVLHIEEYAIYLDSSWHGTKTVINLSPYKVQFEINYENGTVDVIQTYKRKYKYEGSYVVIDTSLQEVMVPNPSIPGKYIIEYQEVVRLVKDGVWYIRFGKNIHFRERWKLGSRISEIN